MSIISSLGALAQFKSGERPQFNVPSEPLNVLVSRPSVSGLSASYKFIKIDWTTPNFSGGFLSGYKIFNNNDVEVANVGLVNTTTITIPIGDIDTQFNYRVAAFNPAGLGSDSIPSANIRSAPSPGTVIGGGIGTYVGDGLVIRNATRTNYQGTINFIENNLAQSSFTGPYFLGSIGMYTTFRTSSGGLLTGAGTTWWSSTSCGASAHNTMRANGTVDCSDNSEVHNSAAFASLV